MSQIGSILALITARGGSKGLPGKNILECAGRPLIDWSIQAAKNSRYVTRTLVSTDCPQIAEVALRGGAEVPFMRPSHLAQDNSPIGQVVQHVLEVLRSQGQHFDYVLLLQATSPLRSHHHIDQAISQYFENMRGDETMVSVYPMPTKMAWIMQKDDQGMIDFCLKRSADVKQRQKLPQLFMPNGAIYFAPTATFNGEFYTANTLPYVMASEDSVDVDTREDLLQAESILRKQQPYLKEISS